MFSVFEVRKGSRYAVVGSGNSAMSDSLMAWKPRMEDPSKLSPSSKTAWSKDETGTVKCCMIPGRSQKRTSIISTPSSLTNFRSSSLFANIRPPWPRLAATCGQETEGHTVAPWPRPYARAVTRQSRDCFGHVTDVSRCGSHVPDTDIRPWTRPGAEADRVRHRISGT